MEGKKNSIFYISVEIALLNLIESMLPKHTKSLFKVLNFNLAKFKNYTSFILYFSQIL